MDISRKSTRNASINPPKVQLDHKEQIALRVGNKQSKKFENMLMKVVRSVQSRTKGPNLGTEFHTLQPHQVLQ